MGIKIAVSGKGGVGKTTIAGAIARSWATQGKRVLAVDADPVNHLGIVLGIPKDKLPTPLSKMSELIEERTGVAPGESFGKLFRLNPKVDDIPDKYSVVNEDGVRFLVLGTIECASSGCFCPENALLRTLIDHLILERDDYLVIDLEAGLEHLGRGSSKGLDVLLLIVEPGQRSIETADRIQTLAAELGIKRVEAVLNKSRDVDSDKRVRMRMEELGIPLLGAIPYDPIFEEADLNGVSPHSISRSSPGLNALSEIARNLEGHPSS